MLPNEFNKFVDQFQRDSHKNQKQEQLWICKPTDLSRGRGITLVNDFHTLKYDQQSIIQKYI